MMVFLPVTLIDLDIDFVVVAAVVLSVTIGFDGFTAFLFVLRLLDDNG